ncbi:MAG: hypothetical protein M3429_04270 [Verrucomicrobiota bacterium]|jgi:hypothetical protein|nr:hypothetical protein [Verrucomicrobiota bacterium]
MTQKLKTRPAPRVCNLYVIRLDRAVLGRRKFKEKNPQHDPRKPCVYVGMTHRTPEERFAQHKRGYRASRYVKRYGQDLIPRQYARFNPMTRTEAGQLEVALAERLRRRGYAVWQN